MLVSDKLKTTGLTLVPHKNVLGLLVSLYCLNLLERNIPKT